MQGFVSIAYLINVLTGAWPLVALVPLIATVLFLKRVARVEDCLDSSAYREIYFAEHLDAADKDDS